MATASQNKDFPQMEVGDLSLREKVGQVLMVGFSGKDPEGAAVAVRDLKVGGIIYFARNTGTVAETAALSQALQDMAASCGNLPSSYPLTRKAVRWSGWTGDFPHAGPMSLGATGDPGSHSR